MFNSILITFLNVGSTPILTPEGFLNSLKELKEINRSSTLFIYLCQGKGKL